MLFGDVYTPVFVYPGKQLHFCRLYNCTEETVQGVLMACHFNKRDPLGVDRRISDHWSKHFVQETENLRSGGHKSLSIFEGYRCHLTPSALLRFRDNEIFAFSLPLLIRTICSLWMFPSSVFSNLTYSGRCSLSVVHSKAWLFLSKHNHQALVWFIYYFIKQ